MLDVLIVGAGPTGLFGAFLSSLRKLNWALVDSLSFAGGQLNLLYPEKHIYDVPGFTKIKAKDLIKNQLAQISNLYEGDLPIHYENEVLEVIKEDDYFKVITNKNEYLTKTVIIAHGGGGFIPQKLSGSDNFTNIDYFVNDAEIYRGKRVAVLGGGDSAFDYGNLLADTGVITSLVHRRDRFRAFEKSIEDFSQKGKIYAPYLIEDIISNNNDNIINQLLLKHKDTKEELVLPVDHLIVNYGFRLTKDYLPLWGIESLKGLISVTSKMETNVSGIYAAGNGVTYPGKVKLIVNGHAEIATAIYEINKLLNPDRSLNVEHSTHLFEE